MVWISATGSTPLLALVASGFTFHLSSQKIRVTLAETSRNLPNAGYYFGLQAEEYLAPALETEAALSVNINSRLRYRLAGGLGPCSPFDDFEESCGHHFIVQAFHFSSGDPKTYLGGLLRAGRECSLGREGVDMVPEAVLIIDDGARGLDDSWLRSIRSAAPEAVFFSENYLGDRGAGENSEIVDFPSTGQLDPFRRAPPQKTIISGLVNSVLQVISGRSKRIGRRVSE